MAAFLPAALAAFPQAGAVLNPASAGPAASVAGGTAIGFNPDLLAGMSGGQLGGLLGMPPEEEEQQMMNPYAAMMAAQAAGNAVDRTGETLDRLIFGRPKLTRGIM